METNTLILLTFLVIGLILIVNLFLVLAIWRQTRILRHTATCPSGDDGVKKRPKRSVTTVRNAHRSRTSKLLSALSLDKEKPKDKDRRTIITHTLS